MLPLIVVVPSVDVLIPVVVLPSVVPPPGLPEAQLLSCVPGAFCSIHDLTCVTLTDTEWVRLIKAIVRLTNSTVVGSPHSDGEFDKTPTKVDLKLS